MKSSFLLSGERFRYLIKYSAFLHAGVLFCFALLLRILRMIQVWNLEDRDFFYYASLAERWYAGGLTYLYHTGNVDVPPLFPGILTLLRHCGVPFEWSGAVCNILCGALLAPVSYMIARLLFGRTLPAFLTGLFIAAQYYLIRISAMLLRDSSYLLFFAAGVWCICLYDTTRRQYWKYLFALASLFAMLARLEGIELLALGTAALFFSDLFPPSGKREKLFFLHTISACILTIGAALLIQEYLAGYGSLWQALPTGRLRNIVHFLTGAG